MQARQIEFKNRDQAIRQCMILAAALILGVVIFAVIAIVLVQFGGMPQNHLQGMMVAVGGSVAAICLIASSIVPQLIPIPEDRSEQSLMQAFLVRNLIQKAILEGAAFLNIVAYIIEQSIWSIGITAGLLAAMLITFPTRTKLDHFIESQTTH